jgi:hypothetical protein
MGGDPHFVAELFRESAPSLRLLQWLLLLSYSR